MPTFLSEITNRLSSVSDTPALDASVLLAHILGKPRTWILAHPDLKMSEKQKEELGDRIQRLERREPLPYVLGHWEFFGLEFDITPDVLIPRPETELLVEKAIAWLQDWPARRRVADVGTGSGIIAVSIAAHVPEAEIMATDVSVPALEVARANARKIQVEDRIQFVHCDLLPEKVNSGQRLDLLCANLPYIPRTTLQNLPIYGREPTVALDGGSDGLDLIRRLLSMAPDWLAPGGCILLETESTLGSQTATLAKGTFPEAKVEVHKDLAGHDRLVKIIL